MRCFIFLFSTCNRLFSSSNASNCRFFRSRDSCAARLLRIVRSYALTSFSSSVLAFRFIFFAGNVVSDN